MRSADSKEAILRKAGCDEMSREDVLLHVKLEIVHSNYFTTLLFLLLINLKAVGYLGEGKTDAGCGVNELLQRRWAR